MLSLLSGMRDTISSFASKPVFVWKAITKSRLRSNLAICGLLAIATLLLRRKRGNTDAVSPDQDVEDFTLNQQAMLTRVREIWDEHCAEDKSKLQSQEVH
jgi:hypothetical protein